MKPYHKRGRPTNFNFDHIHVARAACVEFGATDEQLTALMKCTLGQLRRWIETIPDLKDAIQGGRDKFNTEKIEKTMLQRALGYDYEEHSIKRTTITAGKGKAKVRLPAEEHTVTKKHAVPDMTAIMFFLQNRNPARWRNVKYLIADGEVRTVDRKEFSLDIKSCTQEELQVIRAMLVRKKELAESIEVESTEKPNG